MELPTGGLASFFSYAFGRRREQSEFDAFGMCVEARHRPAEGKRFAPIRAEALGNDGGPQRQHWSAVDLDDSGHDGMMALKALRVRFDLGQFDGNDTLLGNGGGGYPIWLTGESPNRCRTKMGDLVQIGGLQPSRACPACGVVPWPLRKQGMSKLMALREARRLVLCGPEAGRERSTRRGSAGRLENRDVAHLLSRKNRM
ncbi:MAG: hypothetical protein ACLQME_04140 [Alphaproteobacteria bacterium]